jgi:hypothetical protein
MRTFVLGLLLVALPCLAQQKKMELLTRLPSSLHQHSAALGDRVLKPGKEKTVYRGRFADDKGKPSVIKLTLQLGGTVQLEFDDETKPPRNSRLEEALLETFTSDTAEGMLTSIMEGAAVHLLGRRVAPDPAVRGNKTPPLDVFEVTGPVRSSATGLVRLKRYSFDSDSGLLYSTQYSDETFSPAMNIETRFSDWRRIDGSAYPGRVERLENGHVAFAFNADTITASPKQ